MSNVSREEGGGRSGIVAIEAAVLAYALSGSLDLLKAWSHSPIERFGWMALVIWAFPVALLRSRRGGTGAAGPARPLLLGLSVSLVFLGGVSSLNLLQHWGLVLGVMAVTPVRVPSFVWVVAAVSWMPLLGWCLKSLPVVVIPAIRLGIATAGALALMRGTKEGAR